MANDPVVSEAKQNRSTTVGPAALSRRDLVAGAAGALAAGVATRLQLPSAAAQAPPAPVVPPDPTRVQGAGPSASGQRSPFETPKREFSTTSSRTPLQDLDGTVTPSDLHYERHHGGIAQVDPAKYSLVIHGMVDRPMSFSLEDLRRFPSVSRIYFLECAGNFRRNAPEETTAQTICGLTSQSEWTGVLLSTLFREVGVRPEASWFLAEGQDAAVMTRSVPVEKGWDDAMIVYAQNGEPLRPDSAGRQSVARTGLNRCPATRA